MFAGLCDKLFDIDEKLNIVPQLATGSEWADPKTLVIHLRQGVTFQDGEALDADAVKDSLVRDMTLPGSYRKSELTLVDRIDVIDPATIRIALKQPSGAFLATLTDRSGMILAPKVAAAEGKELAGHPVCGGQFKFVERVPQDHVTLERFPGYWDAKDIHFERVEVPGAGGQLGAAGQPEGRDDRCPVHLRTCSVLLNGQASMASTTRLSSMSAMPPANPAINPAGTPIPAAISTETTPASRLARAPKITRAATSRPFSSVPIQCSALGALRMAVQLVAIGSYGEISGANVATSTKTTITTSPATAIGRCRKRNSASRAGLCDAKTRGAPIAVTLMARRRNAHLSRACGRGRRAERDG